MRNYVFFSCPVEERENRDYVLPKGTTGSYVLDEACDQAEENLVVAFIPEYIDIQEATLNEDVPIGTMNCVFFDRNGIML